MRDTSKEARIGSPVGSVGDMMRSDASSRERDGAPVYVEDEPSSALDGDDEQQPWVQPELYITTRAFRKDRSFIGRLPSSAKDALYTGGVCHYLALYRSERGELWQFDFGPFGGDVASRFLNDTGVASGQRDGGSGGATPGHVREKPIDEIPDGGGTYLVGSTDLTLDEIREFNSGRNTMYSVNKNDCRHYVNDLCEHGAGVENVCSKYIRGEVWGKKILSPVDESGENALDQERRRRATELAVLLPILAVTDLDFVPIWDRVGQASTAAILFGVGVRCIPPALMAAAASVAARVGGATASSAASTGATIGVAAANAKSLGLCDRVLFHQHSFCDDLSNFGDFDIILSNPPYIPTLDIAGLEVDVRDFDPALALDGGIDGMTCWRGLLPRLGEPLSDQGAAFVEIGRGQEANCPAGIQREFGACQQPS